MVAGAALVGAEPAGGEAPPAAADHVANQVRELTGAPTRIVWAQQKPGTKADPFTRAADLYLMGLCTEDGKGIRRIMPDAGSYRRPVLSKEGKRIFFGSVPEKKIFVVDWSGGNRRPISSETSSVVDVWTDPGSGEEWVYAVIPAAADPTSGTLVRYGPGGKREQVWDKGMILELYAQLSPDGQMASVQNGGDSRICGMVELPNKGFQPAVNGCWPSMLPCVEPYRLWVFNGNHRSGSIFENPGSPDSQRRWSLDLGGAPLTRNMFECYHPRWSNHCRFLAVTSPYTFQEDGKLSKDDNTIARWNWKDETNFLPHGSENVEVSIGRLNDKLTAVEQWVQVTKDTPAGNWMPDVWIQISGVAAAKSGQPPANRSAAWPATQGGLVFLWRNAIAGNEIRSPEGELIRLCQANPKGPSWFGPQNQLVLCGGMLVPKDADATLLAACRKTNELTIEMIVTPALTETREKAALASFSDGKGSPNFTIVQDGNSLLLTLTTSQAGKASKQELLLFRVNAERTYHLTVSCRPGNPQTDSRNITTVYVNGVRIKTTGSIQGDFGSWTAQPLLFGREGAGGAPWQGTLEAIALYSRVLTEAEVQSHYKILGEALQARKPPARVQVKTKQVAITQMPKDMGVSLILRSHLFRLGMPELPEYRPEQIPSS